MGKVKVLNRQSLIDVALQTSGAMAAVFELALRNGIAITDDVSGMELVTVKSADKLVSRRYAETNLHPATALSREEMESLPLGGIGYMGIEIDFIIS